MSGVYKKSKRDSDTGTQGEGHLSTEAEIELMWLKAKG